MQQRALGDSQKAVPATSASPSTGGATTGDDLAQAASSVLGPPADLAGGVVKNAPSNVLAGLSSGLMPAEKESSVRGRPSARDPKTGLRSTEKSLPKGKKRPKNPPEAEQAAAAEAKVGERAGRRSLVKQKRADAKSEAKATREALAERLSAFLSQLPSNLTRTQQRHFQWGFRDGGDALRDLMTNSSFRRLPKQHRDEVFNYLADFLGDAGSIDREVKVFTALARALDCSLLSDAEKGKVFAICMLLPSTDAPVLVRAVESGYLSSQGKGKGRMLDHLSQMLSGSLVQDVDGKKVDPQTMIMRILEGADQKRSEDVAPSRQVRWSKSTPGERSRILAELATTGHSQLADGDQLTTRPKDQ